MRVDARFIVILSELVSHRGLFDGNTAQRDPTRALHQRHGCTGAMKGKRKVSEADRSNEVHGKDVREVSMHDAYQNHWARADITDQQAVNITPSHPNVGRIGSLGGTPSLVGIV